MFPDSINFLLEIAHQKYQSQDYSAALEILQNIYRVNPSNCAALLLLGCTCYSLGLYQQSFYYNQQIIQIDPSYAEAYSNLGTTCRAIAMHSNPEINMELAVQFYKTALSIRPEYWDANVNLAVLLSSRGEFKEALQVYSRLENIGEQDYEPAHKLENCKLIGSVASFFSKILQILHSRSPITKFSVETWRDIYFAKGNIHCILGDYSSAKQEFLKGLAIVGIDIHFIYQSDVLSPPLITPEQAHSVLSRQRHDQLTSTVVQTVAKIYQDSSNPIIAIKYYYLSLTIYPTANSCNNIGILLAPYRIDEAIKWYEYGIFLEPNHVHICTNLGSALKDKGLIEQGIAYYQKAISRDPGFYIALANLANVYKDMGRIQEAISFYKRALTAKPDFSEAFCNYVNSMLFVCDWSNRLENLEAINEIVKTQLKMDTMPITVPTVLPFHTFTYSTLEAWMIREISRRNADRILYNVTTSDWFPGFSKDAAHPYPYPISPPPSKDVIRIGYVSSDFSNHPLSHLMKSVFEMHSRDKFRVYCYALSPSDTSRYRHSIEKGSDVFLDVSTWSIQQIVEHIAFIDQIHVLVNLNGYTKGGRNEIFAARPCPIQISLMGYAGTIGAGSINDRLHSTVDDTQEDEGYEDFDTDVDLRFFKDLKRRWIDYIVADTRACPSYLVCGEPLKRSYPQQVCREVINPGNDSNRMYTEGIIYLPNTYFVTDHKQEFREVHDLEVESLIAKLTLENAQEKGWIAEQYRRLKMRDELFPSLPRDYVIYANFNQLYKVDPEIFKVWMRILVSVPKSILWLLKFPSYGEHHLMQKAIEIVGPDIAKRILFTGKKYLMIDVAPKHIHVHRGRVADIFLDTPECNAHTTAADVLWSGTPIVTFPKYDFKMCSRVAYSICFATGEWEPGDKYYKKPKQGQNLNSLGHCMVAYSYTEYFEKAVALGNSIEWNWQSLNGDNYIPNSNSSFYPSRSEPTHIYAPTGYAIDLRRKLFLSRDTMPLFDTQQWTLDFEKGVLMAWDKWETEFTEWIKGKRSGPKKSRCIHVKTN